MAAILKSERGTLVPTATEVTIEDDEEIPHEELMATIAMVEPEEFVNNLKEGYQKDTFAKEILDLSHGTNRNQTENVDGVPLSVGRTNGTNQSDAGEIPKELRQFQPG